MAIPPISKPPSNSYKARPSRPTGLDVGRVPTTLFANGASAEVKVSAWQNLMPGPGPRSGPKASVTVGGFGFNDVPPQFSVKQIEAYAQGTNKKILSVQNPEIAYTTGARGKTEVVFGLDLPGDLDMEGHYAFVVTTQINGAAAQQVRSDFVGVDRVY
jgi:hypothetical protein